MKRLAPLFQFLVGIGVVAAVGMLTWQLLPQPKIPDGWQIIRPPRDVMAMTLYGGSLWSGGVDGVMRIDPVSGQMLETIHANGRAFRSVSSFAVAPDGNLWVGHGGGASRFDGSAWQSLTTASGLPSNRVLALASGQQGVLWIGTDRGLARYQDGVIKTFSVEDGLAAPSVSTLFIDSQGRLWAGNGSTAAGGLAVLVGQAWQRVTTADGAHPVINAILEDKPGSLWFATGFASRGGASHLQGQVWSSLTQADGLAGGKVRSLFQDNQGQLWFGFEYDGAQRQNGARRPVLNTDNGLSGTEVKCMLQTPDGDLWLGTENGITRISALALQNLIDQ